MHIYLDTNFFIGLVEGDSAPFQIAVPSVRISGGPIVAAFDPRKTFA